MQGFLARSALIRNERGRLDICSVQKFTPRRKIRFKKHNSNLKIFNLHGIFGDFGTPPHTIILTEAFYTHKIR